MKMLKEISAKPSICLGVNLNVFQILADDSDRSRFLLLYSKIFNIITLQTISIHTLVHAYTKIPLSFLVYLVLLTS